MGGRSGGTGVHGDIAECGAGWDQEVRTGMGGLRASEGMSGAIDRCDAEQRQGKIVAVVPDDCGASFGGRKPAEVSSLRAYFMGA